MNRADKNKESTAMATGRTKKAQRRALAQARSLCAGAVLSLAVWGFGGTAGAETPPGRELIREVAANGTLFEKELGHYTYRQRFEFFELGKNGTPGGNYMEVRDILFNPEGERTEEFVRKPINRLERIRLTEEDFRDIRDVQPFVLDTDNLWIYDVTYKGLEALDGETCYVFRLNPRQVLDGQRLLDGLMWVSREHRQVVRVSGQPVPQIYRESGDNLFPHFTTIYSRVDGKFWFPVKTVADDTLGFRSGVQHVRYTIDFENYKRFTAESTIQFEDAKP